MRSQKIIVLKFGSSVLRTVDDAPLVAHEVYRWVRKGCASSPVVSALEGETDQLLAQAHRADAHPHSAATALLASTGELRVAPLSTLALDRAGIDAQVLDVAAIGLRTRGANPLDAKPAIVNTAKIRRLLARVPVLVLPGFLGRDSIGRTTLLGRGGSDCSALFSVHQLKARCRLVKDVDGLYEWDPRTPGPQPRRFRQLSWDQALELDGGIVQHKAIEFAQRHHQAFEVASLYRRESSVVGKRQAEFCNAHSPRVPLKVVLLGLGTVGRGVYDALQHLPEWFQVVAIGVRDKAGSRGVPENLLHDRLSDAIETPADVVVELIGDCEPASRAIRRVLRRGSSVVTANKRLIALFGGELEVLARATGASIGWSAAVGGAVPLLEQVRRLSAVEPITSIRAVLNGTTNYVLDRWRSGLSFAEALAEAQLAGFAESNPTRDLDGIDAADKLVLIHRELTGEWIDPQKVRREPLDPAFLREWESNQRPAIRQVATWSRSNRGFILRVSLKVLPNRHPLARLKLAENAALLRTDRGAKHFLLGKGAGRWPTSEAVLADLFDVATRTNTVRRQPLTSLETRSFSEVTT